MGTIAVLLAGALGSLGCATDRARGHHGSDAGRDGAIDSGSDASARDSGSSSDAGVDAAPSCACLGGPCCDGCLLRPSSYVCEHDVPVGATCSLAETWPSGCVGGASITVQWGDHYCSGIASICDGVAVSTGREVTKACDPTGTNGPNPILCRQAPPLGAECSAWCAP